MMLRATSEKSRHDSALETRCMRALVAEVSGGTNLRIISTISGTCKQRCMLRFKDENVDDLLLTK